MPNRNFDDITCFPAADLLIDAGGLHILPTIDIAGYSGGINFYVASPLPLTNYVDGEYKFILVHSDELATGYVDVPIEDIIGDTSDYPHLKDLEITATLAEGKAMPFVQAVKLKRYVGLKINASGVTSGAVIQVNYVLNKDGQPVDRSGDDFVYFQG